MARTDYGAILSTVIKDTSDSIREVNKTSALIAPNAWATNIRTMKSASAYQKALDGLKAKTIEKTPIASFNDGAEGVPFNEVLAYITANQSGTGTPSPSNIRPITGHTQAVVTNVGGKNLYDKTAKSTANGYVNGKYIYTDGVEAENANYEISEYIKVVGGADYTLQGLQGDRVFIGWYDNNKEIVGTSRYSNNATRTFTAPSTAVYMRISVYIANEDILQAEQGSTATSYEPYNGNTVTTPLGQTIYGGVLNVTTGELTITHGYVDLSTLSYTTTSWGAKRATIADIRTRSASVLPDAMASNYAITTYSDLNNNKPNNHCAVGSGSSTYIYIVTDTTISGYFAYELATPQTIQLTPQEIEQYLQNTLWASTGDIAVTYLANANVITDESLPFKNIVTFEARSGHTPTGFLLFRNGSYHFFMYMINGDEFYYDTATGKIKRSYFYYTDPDEVSNYFPMTYGAGDWSGQDGGDITCTQAELPDYFFYRTYDIKDQNGNVLLPANCTLADFGF